MKDVEVHKISFKSDGLACAAKLYLPGTKKDALPCVVLANGFSGTMDWILPYFGEHFAKAGFAVFVFDYRYLGESEGNPRQVIDLEKQRTDLRQALQWVRNDSRIDKKKIALWGTSLGGSHVIAIASTDQEIAAVVCNMPAIDAIKGANTKAKAKAAGASSWLILTSTLRLLSAAVLDVVKSLFGLPPYYIDVYGKAGKAIFTDPSLAGRFQTLGEGSPTWKNKVAARVLFDLPKYKNGTIEKIKAPIFLSLAMKDVELDNSYVKEKFSRANNVEIKEYPYDHFSMYHESALEAVIMDQEKFLKKYLQNQPQSK
jgi:dienelactone hydrolase